MLIPKVLIVNDNPASLYAIESTLTSASRKLKFEIMTAQSGEDALRQVLKHDFAVILLDVKMPGMDGFETAEAIHSRPASASIPIIFVTAHFSDEMHRLEGYKTGAVDFVLTPVIPQILQTKVCVFVELAKQRLELQQKTEELARLNRDLQVQRMQDLERINAELKTEIVERKQAELRARELATRDPLTGLLNRRSLSEHLEHAVAYASRRKEHFGLLFLDLDKFKMVNDTLGHDAGDEFLIQVAQRIRSSVREADVVARLGGDEFIVLLKGLTTAAEINKVADKIAKSLAFEYDIDGQRVNTSASIGIAIYPQDGASAQALIKSADIAMYHAKHQRRGSVHFFGEKLIA